MHQCLIEFYAGLPVVVLGQIVNDTDSSGVKLTVSNFLSGDQPM